MGVGWIPDTTTTTTTIWRTGSYWRRMWFMVENGALCPSVTSTFANDLESNEARQYGPSCKRRPGAIRASTWYFGTLTRLRLACVNLQTSQSFRWQLRSWYLLHCPVTTPAQMCRLTRVFAPGWIEQKSPSETAHEILVQWRRLR